MACIYDDQVELVCGIDEAGRGPIAGPVCAAAVVLPPDFPCALLRDSKQLSTRRRLLLETLIKEQAISWAVAWSSRAEIDEINILQATMRAMERAYRRIEQSHICVTLVLVDGNCTPSLPIACEAVVKGDTKIPQIMAASILAKTARDRLMERLDSRYPQWGFAIHKGYPTPAHLAACRAYGLSPVHRRTFRCR